MATSRRTMYPTASKAGDMSAPKKMTRDPPIAAAPSREPFSTPKKLTPSLTTAPNNPPRSTRAPSSSAPPSCPSVTPAWRTEAQATPSGYGSSGLSSINTRRMGIIKSTPIHPPEMAMSVVGQNSNSVHTPIKSKAGTVNRMPAARDSPAEAAVCT